jgi:tryptophan synthase alpha chain
MTPISRTFSSLRERGGKAFIPYTMAGYPSMERTRDTVRLFEECGADIIELGVPFSDPLADGPTIQDASETAVTNGVTLPSVLSLVSSLRKETAVPLVLMSYFNPVFHYGLPEFARAAAEAGVNGLIIPDLPPEEARELIAECRASSIDTIFLLAPTSDDERIRKVARVSRGFIYYVSLTGITGARISIDDSMRALTEKIRSCTDTPLAVGFGVSTPDEASRVASLADGVIVGSAIIKKLNDPREELRRYLAELRGAIR